MRSFKISAAIALVALPLVATPALAQSEWKESRFTRDGDEYVVKSSVAGKTTFLKGHVVGKPVAFNLAVRGDRVRGQVNSTNVEFRHSDAKNLLASR